VYEDLSEYTSADFLTHPEKTTPVFVRFSTMVKVHHFFTEVEVF
jgi:catalase